MLQLKDTMFTSHFFLLNINCNLVTQTVSKVTQAVWCLRWYRADTWIWKIARLMYILKANACRQSTHLKCLWKLVIVTIPLETVGSRVYGKLSEFFEFLLNFKNKPQSLLVPDRWRELTSAIDELPRHSVGGWLFVSFCFQLGTAVSKSSVATMAASS